MVISAVQNKLIISKTMFNFGTKPFKCAEGGQWEIQSCNFCRNIRTSRSPTTVQILDVSLGSREEGATVVYNDYEDHWS